MKRDAVLRDTMKRDTVDRDAMKRNGGLKFFRV